MKSIEDRIQEGEFALPEKPNFHSIRSRILDLMEITFVGTASQLRDLENKAVATAKEEYGVATQKWNSEVRECNERFRKACFEEVGLDVEDPTGKKVWEHAWGLHFDLVDRFEAFVILAEFVKSARLDLQAPTSK
jgi:hypothetical protein